MDQDITKIIWTAIEIVGIACIVLVCVLLFGKAPRIKTTSMESSRAAKLRRNKFAYMNR